MTSFQRWSRALQNGFIAGMEPGLDIEQYWRRKILFSILLVSVIFGVALFAAALPTILHKELWGLLAYDLFVLGAACVLLVSARISPNTKILVGLILLYTTGLVICLSVGILSSGPAWFFCCAIFAGVFFGVRAALAVLLVNSLTLFLLGTLMISGVWGTAFPFFDSPGQMMAAGLNYIFANGVTAVSVSVLLQGFLVARQKEQALAASLKQSNERFHSLADAAMEAILFVHRGLCLQANETAVRLFGLQAPGDLAGMPLKSLIEPEFHGQVLDKVLDAESASRKMAARRLDGTAFPVSVRSRVIDFEGLGKVSIVTMEDLTLQKRSELVSKTLLAISNAVSLTRDLNDLFSQIHHLLGKVFDTTNFFIALVNPKKQTLSFSYFVDEEEVDIPAPTRLNARGSLTGLVAQKKIPMILDRKALEKLAEQKNVEGPLPMIWMGVPLMVGDEVIGVTAVQNYRHQTMYNFSDLEIFFSVSGQIALAIDRKRSEDAIRESEKRYRHLFDNAPAAIYEIDFMEKRITNANAAMCAYTGYSMDEFSTMHPMDMLAEESRAVFPGHLKRVLEERPLSRSYDYKIKKKNGEALSVILNAEFVYDGEGIRSAGVVVHDITERKRMEEMMARSERMMSLGNLAAGMAHEINNPLAGMIQNAQVISNRLSGNLPANLRAAEELGLSMETVSAYMEKRGIFGQLRHINVAGRRAAQIVENMLSFAGSASGEKSSQVLEQLLEETLDLIRNDHDLKKKQGMEGLEIVRDYAPVPPVVCQGSKIQQVFFNLIRNAVEAMASAPAPQAPFRLICRISKAPGRVRVVIEDNGPGMDEQTRKRVFEPFFTTKGVNKGTGLGLAISYYIVVEDHGGELDVDSSPGKGCRFTLLLPVS